MPGERVLRSLKLSVSGHITQRKASIGLLVFVPKLEALGLWVFVLCFNLSGSCCVRIQGSCCVRIQGQRTSLFKTRSAAPSFAFSTDNSWRKRVARALARAHFSFNADGGSTLFAAEAPSAALSFEDERFWGWSEFCWAPEFSFW